jgi:hypothetical protein
MMYFDVHLRDFAWCRWFCCIQLMESI